MANVVMALFTGHAANNIELHKGDLWAADDPFVKKHPDWFSADLESITKRSVAKPVDPPVEQATAAPGEKRQAKR